MTENVRRTIHRQADLLTDGKSGVADGFQFNDVGCCVVDVQRQRRDEAGKINFTDSCANGCCAICLSAINLNALNRDLLESKHDPGFTAGDWAIHCDAPKQAVSLTAVDYQGANALMKGGYDIDVL
ncbi:hypothetical protein Pcaca05_27680 [Pectobacterium carotovorum subsp. carotovorum]|nr:hypothetical protein Pcaca05_27680 [Pectobacterium carotovorum subsp. carotovorum]